MIVAPVAPLYSVADDIPMRRYLPAPQYYCAADLFNGYHDRPHIVVAGQAHRGTSPKLRALVVRNR